MQWRGENDLNTVPWNIDDIEQSFNGADVRSERKKKHHCIKTRAYVMCNVPAEPYDI